MNLPQTAISCWPYWCHEVSAVRAARGSANYEAPDGADPSAFRAAVICSRPLAVTYATARLE